MGCCVSRTSGDSTPAVPANSSSRNITAPSPRPSSIPSPRASHASQGNLQPSRSPHNANDRPNTPLKPLPATQRSRLPSTLASPAAKTSSRVKPLTDSTNLTWTRSRLEKEREDWWDTQVTGSQEIWAAIRLAAQYLQAGELQEAQTMLDATGCTCPTGLLWKGVYDPTGVQYKMPEWVVVEPEGLAEDEDVHDKSVAGPADDEALGELVRVRLRTSHDSKDVSLEIRSRDMAAAIAEKLKAHTKLDSSTKIRLVYGGRVYQEHETLESQPYWDFANNFILTALVFQ
ncbi:ubiquitin domain-containing protein [Stemphylium lycopersici]|nr:ubiquitin domain-containing protein [Stemphylium lycopersici]